MPDCSDVIKKMMALHEELFQFFSLNYDPNLNWLERVLIASISSGQYIFERDSSGELIAALVYLKINDDDIESVKKFELPRQTSAGNVLYIAEAVNKSSDFKISKLVSKMKEKEPSYKSISCHAHNRFRIRMVRG